VVVDGVRAGVVSGGVELAAKGEDSVLQLGSGGMRAGLGTARSRLEGELPVGAVQGHELGHSGFGYPRGGGHLSMGAGLVKDCLDDVVLPTHGALHVNVVGTMF
jgi:hypothetical protein